MRHLACPSCKIPYDAQTRKREFDLPRNYFPEKGLCEPCQTYQTNQIELLKKRNSAPRICKDIAWAIDSTRH